MSVIRSVRTEPTLWCVIGASVALRALLAGLLPLTPDEAYYWVWSRHLQASYLDHPFMVAWWIRLGTDLLGPSVMGVRIVGVFASAGASLALISAGRCLWPQKPQAGLRAACLLNVTLLFGVGMASMTPDTPLMFFSALTLWALSHALYASQGNRQLFWWGLVGGCLGLAGDSKYTALFLALGIAGFVLCSSRRLWCRLGPWVSAGTAGLMVMPVLWWNATHHWASFAKQGGRAGVWHPARALDFLGELLAGQIGLATPLVFLCICIGLWRLWQSKQVSVLLWCLIPGGLIFIAHACGDRVQANWPSVLYPALALVGGGAGRYWKSAVVSSAFLCVAVTFQALWEPLPLAAHWNPILRQTAGWNRLADYLEKRAQEQGAQALVFEDYALASIMAYYHPERTIIIGQDVRWSYLGGLSRRTMDHVLIVRDVGYVFSGKDIVIRSTQRGARVRGYHVQYSEHVTGALLP
ncbi:ArnT family glycosyltransferase [Saccharibacter floricola]|nr:glycosyltransferase family 39 protein [Saccharibacter floricola]